MSHPAPAHCDSKQAASASILSPISLAKQQQQRREGRQQECTTGSVDAEPAEDMEGPLLTDCSEPADESDGEVTVQLDSEEEAAGDGEADADDGLARGHTSMLVPASLPRRTPSLLSSFAQSPLSLSSFPPFGSRQKSQLRNEEESRTPPSSSHPDNAAVLASRLRQERNEAIASLAYCALENDITVKTLESELQELRSGRDNLRQDLQEMVSKLIEGERAQNQLEQVTDTLCQTESSFQQVKGRLETAYAELDDLRARLSESSIRQTTNSPVLASETCTCRSDSDSLRHTIATLEDELDSARRQHLGSTNLVLSLRNDLDQKHRECEAARADSETQTQQIKELQRLLEATKRQAGETQQELQAERKATQNADRVHIERTEEIKETLKEVQLQLQGAVNRALVLQNHLDERQADIAALEIEKEGSESRMAAMQEEILSQSEKTAFASARAETLQAEIYSLQRSVEHMVLLQLQSKRTITAQAYRLRRRASEAPDGRPDNQDPSDLGLMVLLIEASRQLRTLKRRHDAAKQRNVELVERAEALAVENQALSTYTVDNNNQASTIDTLLADKADLQKQLATMRVDRDSIRQELQSAKNLAETSSNIVQTVEANLKDTSTALMTAKTELRESHNIIAGLKQELANARESLRVAEEEGRNLVADFNLLSEELESRQQEDETRYVCRCNSRTTLSQLTLFRVRRSAHTADTERRLAEANAKEEAMRAQRSLDEAALAELTERLQALENDLEQMQISVDEVCPFNASSFS